MSKILGYVVISDSGDGYHAACDTGKTKTTLWFGRHISIFPTRQSARQCLARTKTLMEERGYDWPWIYESTIHVVKAL